MFLEKSFKACICLRQTIFRDGKRRWGGRVGKCLQGKELKGSEEEDSTGTWHRSAWPTPSGGNPSPAQNQAMEILRQAEGGGLDKQPVSGGATER